MRSSLLRLAKHHPSTSPTPSISAQLLNSTNSNTTAAAAAALLPPIPLYRRILRAHRHHLPADMRLLGDKYVKAEFRAHRTTENPVHIVGFLSEWQAYCQSLEGEAWRGMKMDQAKIEKMSDDQLRQMYDLFVAIRDGEGGEEGKEGS